MYTHNVLIVLFSFILYVGHYPTLYFQFFYLFLRFALRFFCDRCLSLLSSISHLVLSRFLVSPLHSSSPFFLLSNLSFSPCSSIWTLGFSSILWVCSTLTMNRKQSSLLLASFFLLLCFLHIDPVSRTFICRIIGVSARAVAAHFSAIKRLFTRYIIAVENGTLMQVDEASTLYQEGELTSPSTVYGVFTLTKQVRLSKVKPLVTCNQDWLAGMEFFISGYAEGSKGLEGRVISKDDPCNVEEIVDTLSADPSYANLRRLVKEQPQRLYRYNQFRSYMADAQRDDDADEDYPRVVLYFCGDPGSGKSYASRQWFCDGPKSCRIHLLSGFYAVYRCRILLRLQRFPLCVNWWLGPKITPSRSMEQALGLISDNS